MKRFQILFFIAAAVVVLMFCGCRDVPLDIAVRYASLGNLRPDSVVYLGQTRIGQIEKIVSSDQGDYMVKVAIDPEYKSEITEYTRFMLSTDPLNRDNAAIVIDQLRTGGKLLESGTTVNGEQRGLVGEFLSRLQQTGNNVSKELQAAVDKVKQGFSQGADAVSARLDEAVGELGRSFNKLHDSWRSGAAQQELDKMQRNIDQFIAEFKKSGAEVQKKMRQEIIPEIRKQLEAIEKNLRQEHRDSDADQVERQLTELTQV